jgi:hypothetical protein
MALVQSGEGIPSTTVTPGQAARFNGVPGGRGGRGGRAGGIPNYGPSGGRDVNPIGSPIDRAGVPTSRSVRQAVDYIGDILGSPIQFGTGSQHSQMTSSGNVSDHWGGGAIDLPAAGKRLMAMGRSALIAAGMSPRAARKHRGGIVNVNGWQVIFNTDDHYDHVHVAPPSGWRRPGGRRRGRRR